jgi:hypothetical protein
VDWIEEAQAELIDSSSEEHKLTDIAICIEFYWLCLCLN